jgi:hypothetical protein
MRDENGGVLLCVVLFSGLILLLSLSGFRLMSLLLYRSRLASDQLQQSAVAEAGLFQAARWLRQKRVLSCQRGAPWCRGKINRKTYVFSVTPLSKTACFLYHGHPVQFWRIVSKTMGKPIVVLSATFVVPLVQDRKKCAGAVRNVLSVWQSRFDGG